MKKNFHIGQSNELVVNQKIIDVHNDYYIMSPPVFLGSDLHVTFCGNVKYDNTVVSPFKIIFKEVDRYEISELFPKNGLIPVDEMGYKDRADRDDNWLLSQEQSNGTEDFFFRLEDKNFLRVHAKCASIVCYEFPIE